MLIVWDLKMRVLLCFILVTACTCANKHDNRNKLPFVADAVGNTLPPPSNVPATVGSPVNLLTPDRYEFYTFDESGELVKRLMTLEEIQAIVAAGEDTAADGLVTFANESPPTVSFNIHQPPYNKVHNVVTNVQNVLKAQMEAHKNKPHIQPTLDTPDVSDSWSLILPSIFGNTGVDIVLDKASGSVTTPETETIEENVEDDQNSLSKEGNNQVLISSTTSLDNNINLIDKTTAKISTTSTSSITTTEVPPKPTTKPTTTTRPAAVTFKPTTNTPKPVTTSATKPTTIFTPKLTTSKVFISSTKKPVVAASKKPLSTTRTTPASVPPIKTTTKTRTKITTIPPTTTTTTIKPVIRTTQRVTTTKLQPTTTKHLVDIPTKEPEINVQIQSSSNTVSSTERNEIQFEKISTFIPVSTVKYVSERTTKPAASTKAPLINISTTKRYTSTTTESPTTQRMKVHTEETTLLVSTENNANEEKINTTTITTQSVSPSTTVSSTEVLSADKVNLPSSIEENNNSNVPVFDVAQSISQIASDLGGSYQPMPTSNTIIEDSNESQINMESKENLDIDIPSGFGNDTVFKRPEHMDKSEENFIKVSTIDPHNINKEQFKENVTSTILNDIKDKENSDSNKSNIIVDTIQKIELTSTPHVTESTTIDPILSESMGDLLSQVRNEAPTIVDTKKQQEQTHTTVEDTQIYTTVETIKNDEVTTMTGISLKVEEEPSTTTEKSINKVIEKDFIKENDAMPVINNTFTEKEHVESATNRNDILKNSNEDTVKTHIEISQSINKNESNAKFNETVSTLNTKSGPQVSDLKENQKLETVKIENDNKTSEIPFEPEISTATVTTLSDLELDSKIDTKIKIIPPESNKININDKTNNIIKNGKLPEPLPKVDDFRKKIQKVNIDEEDMIRNRNNSWKLIPTLSPPKVNEIPKEKVKSDDQQKHENSDRTEVVLEFSNENQGLEVTTKDLGEDIARFSELSNELAFRYWSAIIDDIDKRRSFVFSPYSTFSMLAMIFMGARGATSGEMNEILKLDDMVTFNPHFALKNISDSIETTPQSGVAVSVFARELYSDRNKGNILTFYKERAQHFYNGHVEEINFKLISDIIRRRTNLLIKRYTWGKMPEYMKTNNIVMQPPLAAFTVNIFETDCSDTSVDGRDGEMYFVVSPNVRQRRLVPVPAVVYKKGFLAGYEPVLDVTVAALGNTKSIVSTLFLMPGQQGNVVHADDLEKLEQRLVESTPTTPTWNRVLRSLLPRNGLELQIPRFAHKSTFNASMTLKKMGLKDLFDGEHADLGGLNGPSKDLYLSDMVQLNTFVTCGEGMVGEQHHIEEYPETLTVAQRRRARWLNDWDEPRDYQRAFHDPHDISDAMHLPLHLRPRQARLPARSNQPARLKFDRPFLYFVRHNPSGMILYFGRYNPRLLP